MEDTNGYKFVDFHKYCASCKYETLGEAYAPCCYCLIYTVNLYSHKPVEWKEKEK